MVDNIADEEPELKLAIDVGSFEALVDSLDFNEVGDAGIDPVDTDDPLLPPLPFFTWITPLDLLGDIDDRLTSSYLDPFVGCILDSIDVTIIC